MDKQTRFVAWAALFLGFITLAGLYWVASVGIATHVLVQEMQDEMRSGNSSQGD